jgi:hypothetical protein
VIIMSGISALGSVAQTWLTQKVNGAKNGDSDGDKDNSSVSGAGSSQQNGAFMQDIMQSLQGLGLNLSSVSSNGTPDTTSATLGVSATSSDVGHALHTFMHDLHQSLRQSGVAQQPPTTDSSTPSSTKNGYSDFASNLQNLIGSLNSTSGTPASTSTDPTLQNLVNNVAGIPGVSGATGTNQNKLQTDFSNLLSAIGSGSGPTSSTTPTLQDFLNKMVSNWVKLGKAVQAPYFQHRFKRYWVSLNKRPICFIGFLTVTSRKLPVYCRLTTNGASLFD